MTSGQTAGSDPAQFAIYPSLRGRKVLITGGASGIGESMVLRFAEQGAQVSFLDIQDEPAAQLIKRIVSAGHLAPRYLHCDLTDVQAIRECVEKVVRSCDGLDVLVNNAGNDERHNLENVSVEMWDRLMAVNLRHVFFVTQAALPALRKSSHGSVINMSSISWLIPPVGLPVYVAAKASIVGLTRSLAHEAGADNVRVNCVLPGSIVTERQTRLWLTPEYTEQILSRQALKRQLSPDEVARLVLFLAADDSSAITAQSYVIDGGWV